MDLLATFKAALLAEVETWADGETFSVRSLAVSRKQSVTHYNPETLEPIVETEPMLWTDLVIAQVAGPDMEMSFWCTERAARTNLEDEVGSLSTSFLVEAIETRDPPSPLVKDQVIWTSALPSSDDHLELHYFMTGPPRYANLFRLRTDGSKVWAVEPPTDETPDAWLKADFANGRIHGHTWSKWVFELDPEDGSELHRQRDGWGE